MKCFDSAANGARQLECRVPQRHCGLAAAWSATQPAPAVIEMVVRRLTGNEVTADLFDPPVAPIAMTGGPGANLHGQQIEGHKGVLQGGQGL